MSSNSLEQEISIANMEIEKNKLENEVVVLKGTMSKLKECEKERIVQHKRLEKLTEQQI